jgi:hypothetical protein
LLAAAAFVVAVAELDSLDHFTLTVESTFALSPRQAPKAVFGSLSLLVFIGDFAALLYFVLTNDLSYGGGEAAFRYVLGCVFYACSVSILSVVLAIIGVGRHECPRWPAIIGLVLSTLPAAGGICLFILFNFIR